MNTMNGVVVVDVVVDVVVIVDVIVDVGYTCALAWLSCCFITS